MVVVVAVVVIVVVVVVVVVMMMISKTPEKGVYIYIYIYACSRCTSAPCCRSQTDDCERWSSGSDKGGRHVIGTHTNSSLHTHVIQITSRPVH